MCSSNGKGPQGPCDKCDKPVHRDLETFITGHGRELTGRLHTFLKDKPETVPVRYESRDVLKQVFQLAKEFQEAQQAIEWKFNDIQMAMWVLMRYSSVLFNSIPGHGKPKDHSQALESAKKSLLSVEPCLKHFLRGLAGLPVRGIPAPKIPGDTERAAIERDGGACVLMGTADPEAVSILPFGDGMKHMKQADQDAIDYLLRTGTDPTRTYPNRHNQIMSGLKSGGCSWTMLSLSPQMRDWWNRMYFTLEFRGMATEKNPKAANPCQVSLRFRWLPIREKGKDARSVKEGRTCLEPLNLMRHMNGHHLGTNGGPAIAAVIPGSWQPLATGQIFHVNVASDEDGWKMGRLLDMRLNLSDIAHMSNAASVTSELVELYRQEDEEQSDTMSNFSIINTPSDSGSESGELIAVS